MTYSVRKIWVNGWLFEKTASNNKKYLRQSIEEWTSKTCRWQPLKNLKEYSLFNLQVYRWLNFPVGAHGINLVGYHGWQTRKTLDALDNILNLMTVRWYSFLSHSLFFSFLRGLGVKNKHGRWFLPRRFDCATHSKKSSSNGTESQHNFSQYIFLQFHENGLNEECRKWH